VMEGFDFRGLQAVRERTRAAARVAHLAGSCLR